MTVGPSRLPARITAKIIVSPDLSWQGVPCWEWQGATNPKGYGTVTLDKRSWFTHRLVYERLIGPIVAETLDHRCRVRHCCNPAHLEPVSSRVNTLMGDGPTARNARKTHCHNGHPLSGDNLKITSQGRRLCRTCERARRAENGDASRAYARAYRARNAEAVKAGQRDWRERNPDYNREWHARNPDYNREYRARRRAELAHRGGEA